MLDVLIFLSFLHSPAEFRELFGHDEIIRLRRKFVEYVQDGGVRIEDLELLDIEEEAIEDLLNKHKQNAQTLLKFGAFLAAKLESDKYAEARRLHEREAGVKQTNEELRAELKRLKQKTEEVRCAWVLLSLGFFVRPLFTWCACVARELWRCAPTCSRCSNAKGKVQSCLRPSWCWRSGSCDLFRKYKVAFADNIRV